MSIINPIHSIHQRFDEAQFITIRYKTEIRCKSSTATQYMSFCEIPKFANQTLYYLKSEVFQKEKFVIFPFFKRELNIFMSSI